jgi:hypothetical protein
MRIVEKDASDAPRISEAWQWREPRGGSLRQIRVRPGGRGGIGRTGPLAGSLGVADGGDAGVGGEPAEDRRQTQSQVVSIIVVRDGGGVRDSHGDQYGATQCPEDGGSATRSARGLPEAGVACDRAKVWRSWIVTTCRSTHRTLPSEESIGEDSPTAWSIGIILWCGFRAHRGFPYSGAGAEAVRRATRLKGRGRLRDGSGILRVLRVTWETCG